MSDIIPHDEYPYHYIPTGWICALYIALFGLTTCIHSVQAARFRLWWMVPTVVFCGLGEILGWSGRLWSSMNPALLTPFLMQISCTIFSPTFLVAANFIILGRILRILGPQYSRLTPAAYSYIFLTADSAALIVQAVGGSQASAAETLEAANRGANVMLGGIILQLVAIVLYVALAVEFFVRFARDVPVRKSGAYSYRPSTIDEKVKRQIFGLGFGTIFLLVRTIYRTIELQDGWTGKVITNETLFNALDGMPIVVAMFTLNAFHPGALVFNRDRELPQLLSGGSEKADSTRSPGV